MVMRMPSSTLGHPAEKQEPTVARAVTPAADAVGSKVRREDKPVVVDGGLDDEKCPIIRANRIIFSSATAGRLKIVFF
jgi:hypothetical protein